MDHGGCITLKCQSIPQSYVNIVRSTEEYFFPEIPEQLVKAFLWTENIYFEMSVHINTELTSLLSIVALTIKHVVGSALKMIALRYFHGKPSGFDEDRTQGH